MIMDANELRQNQQLEEMKRRLLSGVLTKEAHERLGRVRTVNPALASQAEIQILQLHQSGRLRMSVTDAQVKEILRILSEKRDISIKRK